LQNGEQSPADLVFLHSLQNDGICCQTCINLSNFGAEKLEEKKSISLPSSKNNEILDLLEFCRNFERK